MKIKKYKEFNECLNNLMTLLPFFVKINLIDSPIDHDHSMTCIKKLSESESDIRVILATFLASESIQGGLIEPSDEELSNKWTQKYKDTKWSDISSKYLDGNKFKEEYKMNIPIKKNNIQKGNMLFKINNPVMKDGQIVFDTNKLIPIKEYFDDEFQKDINEIEYLKGEINNKKYVDDLRLRGYTGPEYFRNIINIYQNPVFRLFHPQNNNFFIDDQKYKNVEVFSFTNPPIQLKMMIQYTKNSYGVMFVLLPNKNDEPIILNKKFLMDVKETNKFIDENIYNYLKKYDFDKKYLDLINKSRKNRDLRLN